MIKTGHQKYGPHTALPQGFAVTPGDDLYRHRIGGAEWKIQRPELARHACQILTLDLADPRLSGIKSDKLQELPLVCNLKLSDLDKRQVYAILPQERAIAYLLEETHTGLTSDEICDIAIPLPQKNVKLRNLTADEYATDEDLYWKACDRFVGGAAFIRILNPVWLQWPEEEHCACGRRMTFICCIGYENYNVANGFLGNGPFFLGEFALYYFFCPECLKVNVLMQST